MPSRCFPAPWLRPLRFGRASSRRHGPARRVIWPPPRRLAAWAGTTVALPGLASCVTASKCARYRNVDRFPVGYAPQPRLRGRLTPRGLPLRGNPQVSGGRGSHPSLRYSCLHSLFRLLQRPSRRRLPRSAECSPTARAVRRGPAASVPCLAPLHCLRGDARPVSCYALFQGMAASGPTSWLSAHPHIISHSAWLRDLGRRSGLFPSRRRTLSPAVSLPRGRLAAFAV